jgi:hypothetical protein
MMRVRIAFIGLGILLRAAELTTLGRNLASAIAQEVERMPFCHRWTQMNTDWEGIPDFICADLGPSVAKKHSF